MEYRYYQFPLIMLGKAHSDFKKAAQDIVCFAAVDFALKQKIDLDDAGRELLYAYHRDRPNAYEPAMQLLVERFNNHDEYSDVEFTADDYLVFDGHGKVSEDTVCQIGCLLRKDSELADLAIINKQLRGINDFFNMTGSSPNSEYSVYKIIKDEIKEHEARHGKEPRPTIETGLFWDLCRDNDPELFAAYMAIRSIEGQGNYAMTTRPAIAGRMTGAKSPAVLNDRHTINGKVRGVYERYRHRYHFDKLMTRLHKRGLLKSMMSKKGWRHMFLSTRLSPDQLGEAVALQANKRQLKDSINKALAAYKETITTTL